MSFQVGRVLHCLLRALHVASEAVLAVPRSLVRSKVEPSDTPLVCISMSQAVAYRSAAALMHATTAEMGRDGLRVVVPASIIDSFD